MILVFVSPSLRYQLYQRHSYLRVWRYGEWGEAQGAVEPLFSPMTRVFGPSYKLVQNTAKYVKFSLKFPLFLNVFLIEMFKNSSKVFKIWNQILYVKKEMQITLNYFILFVKKLKEFFWI